MTSFSRGERQTIDSFAGQLGLPVRLAPDGSCSFVFATTGTLTMTPARDGGRTVVSLARNIGWLDTKILARALGRAGYDAAYGRAIHAGLAGDDALLFMTSIREGDMSLPVLEECLQQLRSAHDALR